METRRFLFVPTPRGGCARHCYRRRAVGKYPSVCCQTGELLLRYDCSTDYSVCAKKTAGDNRTASQTVREGKRRNRDNDSRLLYIRRRRFRKQRCLRPFIMLPFAPALAVGALVPSYCLRVCAVAVTDKFAVGRGSVVTASVAGVAHLFVLLSSYKTQPIATKPQSTMFNPEAE